MQSGASYFVIGLMSGTSLDGLDIVYAKFTFSTHWDYSILAAETIPYPTDIYTQLQQATRLDSPQLLAFDIALGKYFGKCCNQFIVSHRIDKVDCIASHGHTIFHQPSKGFTLQIGSGDQIAKITQKKVVYDFRSQDVALGGQGAPLVPMGDELLFSTFDYCLNLGGFSNISFKKNNNRWAYDISPVNTVLNFYANQLGLDYDNQGIIASKNTADEKLFNQLNALEFYQKSFPKSLGIEWVHQYIFPLIEASNLSVEDKIATFTEHTAYQIAKNIEKDTKVLVTGGGAFNTYLLERINFYTPIQLITTDITLINYKEALLFALLGLLRLHNLPNVLSSVTGAPYDHSSGIITNL